jgi:hypothetical protein
MKSKILFIAVLLILPLCPRLGYAQTSHRPPFTAEIPFEFAIGNQTFPAGTYKFRSLLNSFPGKGGLDVLEMRSIRGHLYKALLADVVASEEFDNPSLVFTNKGGCTVLSEVWEPGKQTGWRLHKSVDRMEMAVDDNERVTLRSAD